MRTIFAKVLVFSLILALTLGQGPMISMAMPVMNVDQMPMNMAGMDNSDSDQTFKDCCDPSAKDKAMKSAMCSACCAANVQTAMLPFQVSASIHYTAPQHYELTDITAISKSLPPEPPPPKA